MNHITVYTKDTTKYGLYRISAIDASYADTKTNYFYHLMQILRIKGIPSVPSESDENTQFTYDFAFNFGG